MNRRVLLSVIAGTAVVPKAVHAISMVPSFEPRLRLFNPHTKETFDGPYRDIRGPLPAAMADLSEFLRDFRSDAAIAIDIGVIDFLAAVMDAINVRSATILSAYRTPETNAMLARTAFGVAENSQHLYGRALDVRFESRLQEAMLVARAMQRGGVGWYGRSGFIHIDTGPVRNWELDEAGLATILGERRNLRLDPRADSVGGIRSGQIKPNLDQSGHHLRELNLSGDLSAELRSRGRFLREPGVR
jgi:uncharacterized protein YcbK (DUF882 family)